MQTSDKKNWLICIDDTDDIGTKGTGEIAEEIAVLLLDEMNDAHPLVTRHQLYVHPDIPYTSHNSAMCFELASEKSLTEIKTIAVKHLLAECACASDPGLAILDLSSSYDRLALIEFGLKAKVEVKTKVQAYDLAAKLDVSLSEHGGTGQGVIGALAGIGLRLYGQDGRVKGQVKLNNGLDQDSSVQDLFEITVADILRRSELDSVVTISGDLLGPDERLYLTGKVKAIFWQHQFALLVYRDKGRWCNALKQHLKEY
ncbi:DNA-binding protein [Shewanella eurypsychrophilus]|uniref:DNA-binding protein n=1 Tax=Shewanella eurypsychrophilus TaxID=2593656 RepID=A0ABX6V157_9GAMM|nr:MULTISPECIES: DNA-binding protein [Shewanella]QFU20541.1 DNA-binding protein [Shewanella sp. YLB-09]QFU20822.1 DNA-binding protein [Shewanella sp. YLB-09]QPG56112.1 DNA-binding protein [Shewanella eurypsychrophilus]